VDACVCPLPLHYLASNFPHALLLISAATPTIRMAFPSRPAALPKLHSDPGCHSNPIAHRVRRKRQRLPPSLLIENASDRDPAPSPAVCPEAFPIKASDQPPAIDLLTGERIWNAGMGTGFLLESTAPHSQDLSLLVIFGPQSKVFWGFFLCKFLLPVTLKQLTSGELGRTPHFRQKATPLVALENRLASFAN